MATLGIDIGGSGIKGALVDTRRGVLSTERVRIKTPKPATPDAVLDVIADIANSAGPSTTAGLTFPGVVTNGVVRTAVHLHPSWIGVNLAEIATQRLGRQTAVLNDADAAGLAEVAYGVAKGQRGVVLMLTFGTGVGSGLFVDGALVPNTEIGHLPFGDSDAESEIADSVREKKGLSWKKWAKRTNDYLALVEDLFSPELIVIGGGIDKHPDDFMPLLHTTAPLRIAALGNTAGMVGAAMTAARAQARQRARRPSVVATDPPLR
jgi:polyphosphate glucokinase